MLTAGRGNRSQWSNPKFYSTRKAPRSRAPDWHLTICCEGLFHGWGRELAFRFTSTRPLVPDGPWSGFYNYTRLCSEFACDTSSTTRIVLEYLRCLSLCWKCFQYSRGRLFREIDKQKQAADIMQKHIQSFGIPMEHLIAPGLEHKFPPEWQQKAFAAYAPHIAKGRAVYPEKIKFVTYTLKYPKCDWVEILGLKSTIFDQELKHHLMGKAINYRAKTLQKWQSIYQATKVIRHCQENQLQ